MAESKDSGNNNNKTSNSHAADGNDDKANASTNELLSVFEATSRQMEETTNKISEQMIAYMKQDVRITRMNQVL